MLKSQPQSIDIVSPSIAVSNTLTYQNKDTEVCSKDIKHNIQQCTPTKLTVPTNTSTITHPGEKFK